MGMGTPPQQQMPSQPPAGMGVPPQQRPSQPPMGMGTPPQQQMPSQPPAEMGMSPQGGVYNGPQTNGMPMQQQQQVGVATAKKPMNKGVLIIGGLVLAGIILIVAIIMVISSLFSGAKDDANLGIWNAVEFNAMGVTLTPSEYGSEVALELKSGGNCTLVIDGDGYDAKWELEGTDFIVSDGSDEFVGTLANGELKLINLLNMGIDITFMKDGAPAPRPEPTPDTSTTSGGLPSTSSGNGSELTGYWNRSWYGIVSLYETDGKYEEFYYDTLDAYIVVNVNDNGVGQFSVYADDGMGEPFVAGDCTVQIGEEAGLYATSVNMGDTTLNADDWAFLPSSLEFEDKFEMETTITDEDGDLISFVIYMKPYGVSWQDEIDSEIYEFPEWHDYMMNTAEPLYASADATNISSNNTYEALGGYGYDSTGGTDSGAEELYSLDFTLINHSGANLTEIRLSEVSDPNFGENLLEPGETLPDGYSVEITFDSYAAAGTMYDMYTLDDDGDEYEYHDLELTVISTVTLHWERQADGSYTNYYVVE